MNHIAIFGMAHAGTSLLYVMLMTSVVSHRFLPHEKWPGHSPAVLPTIYKESEQLHRGKEWDRPIVCIRDPRALITALDSVSGRPYYTHERLHDKWWLISAHYKNPVFVRYEDLVSNPDEVQAMLQKEFPSLVYQAKFSEYLKRKEWILGYDFWARAMFGLRPLDTGHKERGDVAQWLLDDMGYA